MAVEIPYQHVVYRFYDAADALLYVGRTKALAARIGQHKSQTPWWSEVESMETGAFPGPTEARAAEREYIKNLLPRYNVHHNSGLVAAATVEEVAELLKVSTATVRRWIKDGELGARWFSSHYRIYEQDLKEFIQRHRTNQA